MQRETHIDDDGNVTELEWYSQEWVDQYIAKLKKDDVESMEPFELTELGAGYGSIGRFERLKEEKTGPGNLVEVFFNVSFIGKGVEVTNEMKNTYTGFVKGQVSARTLSLVDGPKTPYVFGAPVPEWMYEDLGEIASLDGLLP